MSGADGAFGLLPRPTPSIRARPRANPLLPHCFHPAQAISGVILSVAGRSTLLEEYESKYKGPMGLMGFPTGREPALMHSFVHSRFEPRCATRR